MVKAFCFHHELQMQQYVLIQLTVILFVWSTGASKLCSLVVSVNLMLLGRLASRNWEGGREWRIEHGRAPLGCHGSREMHPGIVCFQGEVGCLSSIGQLKADWLVDLLLIGCVIKIQSNIKTCFDVSIWSGQKGSHFFLSAWCVLCI